MNTVTKGIIVSVYKPSEICEFRVIFFESLQQLNKLPKSFRLPFLTFSDKLLKKLQ